MASPTELLMVVGNITPSVNNTYDLSNSTHRWRNIWAYGNITAGDVKFSNDFRITEPTASSIYALNLTLNFNKNLYMQTLPIKFKMPTELKSKILSAVKREPMPIFQIAMATGLSVQTTSKYCHILQAENKIAIAKFGNMKMVRRR